MAEESFSSSGDGGGEQETMLILAQQLQFNLELDDFMESALDRLGIEPSLGARLMLLIPLAEERDRGDLDRQYVENSLYTLLEEMAERPAGADRDFEDFISREYGIVGRKFRTSVSVIKAFWQRFCSIPPFCGEREG